jgi:ABC-type multidrug transport system fused ATPase/permease subunit
MSLAATVNRIMTLIGPGQVRRMVVLLGMMILGMALEMLGVGLIVPMLIFLTRSDYAGRFPAAESALAELGIPGREGLVMAAMLVLVVVFLVKAAFLAVLIWCQSRFAFSIQAKLSQRLFTAYLMQPYTFHLQRNSAQLLRNLTSEVGLFTSYVLVPGFLLITEALVVLGLCMMLLIIEPVGAAVVIVVMASASWIFDRLTRRRIAHWGFARQHHEGQRIQHLQQGLGGAKEVKVLGREREFLEQYRSHNERTAHVSHLHIALNQMPRLWLELLAVIGLATLVFAMLAQNRPLESIVTTLGLFAAAAFRVIPSANRIIAAGNTVRYSGPIIQTLYEEMQLEGSMSPSGDFRATPFREVLALKNVTFTYPDAAEPALKGLSLSVRCGESVGIMGTSGAGKTTLVDVLLGLLVPQRGDVTVDGESIQTNPRAWQHQIGYVPQSIYLTDDTLRRNVALGLPDEQIDDRAVWRSLQDAQLDDFVRAQPDGLDTIVGERGVRLSGGQRQRIGIARALYHGPRVLMLDEATSSLDPETERGVMEAVKALHEKTIIIVAHRLSTVAHCDRVLIIERGCVAREEGRAIPSARDRLLRPAN